MKSLIVSYRRSVTAESAKKSDSRHAEIVANLQFLLKKANDDGISLPGELQSRASDLLIHAGVSSCEDFKSTCP